MKFLGNEISAKFCKQELSIKQAILISFKKQANLKEPQMPWIVFPSWNMLQTRILGYFEKFQKPDKPQNCFSCFRCAVNKKGYFDKFQHKKHTKSHNWSRIIFHALNMLQTSIFATAWPREVVARGGHPFGCKRKSLTGFFAFWTTQ